MRTVGSEKVECVFDVTYRLDVGRKKRQQVILSKDSSDICASKIRGSSVGFFFHLKSTGASSIMSNSLQCDGTWITYRNQESQKNLFRAVFACYDTKGKRRQGRGWNVWYTCCYLYERHFQDFPQSTTSLSRDDQSQPSKKRRHGEISGLAKNILNVVDSSPELFEMVKESLGDVIVRGRGLEGMGIQSMSKRKVDLRSHGWSVVWGLPQTVGYVISLGTTLENTAKYLNTLLKHIKSGSQVGQLIKWARLPS